MRTAQRALLTTRERTVECLPVCPSVCLSAQLFRPPRTCHFDYVIRLGRLAGNSLVVSDNQGRGRGCVSKKNVEKHFCNFYYVSTQPLLGTS